MSQSFSVPVFILNQDTDSMPCWKSALIVTMLSLRTDCRPVLKDRHRSSCALRTNADAFGCFFALQLLSTLVVCLSTDHHCFSMWRQMYDAHLSQSSVLMNHMLSSWDRLQKKVKYSSVLLYKFSKYLVWLDCPKMCYLYVFSHFVYRKKKQVIGLNNQTIWRTPIQPVNQTACNYVGRALGFLCRWCDRIFSNATGGAGTVAMGQFYRAAIKQKKIAHQKVLLSIFH